eukprot:2754546-Amphidinium_carterae.1
MVECNGSWSYRVVGPALLSDFEGLTIDRLKEQSFPIEALMSGVQTVAACRGCSETLRRQSRSTSSALKTAGALEEVVTRSCWGDLVQLAAQALAWLSKAWCGVQRKYERARDKPALCQIRHTHTIAGVDSLEVVLMRCIDSTIEAKGIQRQSRRGDEICERESAAAHQ